jgi:hypothetical protein
MRAMKKFNSFQPFRKQQNALNGFYAASSTKKKSSHLSFLNIFIKAISIYLRMHIEEDYFIAALPTDRLNNYVQ